MGEERLPKLFSLKYSRNARLERDSPVRNMGKFAVASDPYVFSIGRPPIGELVPLVPRGLRHG